MSQEVAFVNNDAEEDKKKRESVEARNKLDSLVYSTEKTLAEHGSALSEVDRGTLDTALQKAKTSLEGNDGKAMEAAFEELMKASHKLSEEMYKKAAAGNAAGAENGSSAGTNGTSGKSDDENVVDADFEEVNDAK